MYFPSIPAMSSGGYLFTRPPLTASDSLYYRKDSRSPSAAGADGRLWRPIVHATLSEADAVECYALVRYAHAGFTGLPLCDCRRNAAADIQLNYADRIPQEDEI